jgi:hypothetical protein
LKDSSDIHDALPWTLWPNRVSVANIESRWTLRLKLKTLIARIWLMMVDCTMQNLFGDTGGKGGASGRGGLSLAEMTNPNCVTSGFRLA